jgi:hypothetical protein
MQDEEEGNVTFFFLTLWILLDNTNWKMELNYEAELTVK